MEQETTEERKQSLIKGLAVAGLLGLTIAIAWLAIQIVQVAPAAINSLASLAGSVYNYNPLASKELALQKNDTIINLNEPFSVSWEQPNINGSFVFSYTCASSVTLDLTAAGANFTDLRCGESYNLGSSTNLIVTARQSTAGFTDIPYTIAFYRPNSDTPAASADAILTVRNPIVTTTPPVTTSTDPAPTVPTATSTEDTPSETPITTPESESPTPATSTASATPAKKPTAPTPQPAKPVVSQPMYTYTYGLPTSQPDGYTDLVVSLVGVGTTNRTGAFVASGLLPADATGALQFAIHNIGTRTSDTWSYTLTLPGGGTYTRTDQAALRPNERAVITIAFPVSTNAYVEPYTMNVTTTRDKNLATNQIESVVLIAR